MRRRGLKHATFNAKYPAEWVASRAEAWIETGWAMQRKYNGVVASRAEAWIETIRTVAKRIPSKVASRAEALIETVIDLVGTVIAKGRLPCGGVD